MKKKRVEWSISLYPYNSEDQALYPRVNVRGTISIYDLAYDLSRRTGTHMEVIRRILSGMEDLAEEYLIEGYAVSSHLGTLTPSVTGMWDPNRLFPSARQKNQAVARFAMSNRLKDTLYDPLFRVRTSGQAVPQIYEVRNTNALDADREEWMPGDILIIQGKFLLMSGEDPERGVYFVNDETDEVAVHIPAEHLLLNERAEIKLKVPRLPAGEYRLRIMSQCTTSPRPLRKARAGEHPTVYTVIE